MTTATDTMTEEQAAEPTPQSDEEHARRFIEVADCHGTTLGEFWDFLQGKGMRFVTGTGRPLPEVVRAEEMIAEFFGIDLAAVERHRRLVLARLPVFSRARDALAAVAHDRQREALRTWNFPIEEDRGGNRTTAAVLNPLVVLGLVDVQMQARTRTWALTQRGEAAREILRNVQPGDVGAVRQLQAAAQHCVEGLTSYGDVGDYEAQRGTDRARGELVGAVADLLVEFGCIDLARECRQEVKQFDGRHATRRKGRAR